MSLEWNVYIENPNARKIETFNVFDHISFFEDCRKNLKKCGDDRVVFDDALRHELMYYFWSKCEYEIVLSDWPPSERFDSKKVDVYSQIMLNWPVFSDYVWNNRKELTKRRKKRLRDGGGS